MNIGIIVYSQTGHTRSVADQLKGKLEEQGQSVTIVDVTISGEASPGKFQFTSAPSVEGYDAIIFGAPVHAFRLTSVMETYLQQLPSLEGKETAYLVTKQLPFLWMGGTKAVSTMEHICQEKGAQSKGGEVAVWSDKKRDASVQQSINNLAKLFS